MFVISALSMICLWLASLTFKSFPRRGNTPYLSPQGRRECDPGRRSVLTIRVHCSEDFPPASLASSSLGMPVMRCRFAPSFFFSSLLCLKSDQVNTLSTSPHLATAQTMYRVPFFKKSADNSHLEPMLLARVVSVSFVCESNVGLSISALTKTHIWFLT
ncbi:hypothetical protein M758_5G130300 [Ceratodon purpureus]|nr:hypothetical protein M758_5G130300 [Ceratodon purpureus]